MEGHVAVDDPARHEDRRGDLELREHRRRREQVVAVAVVEGHAHVAARHGRAQQLDRAIEPDRLCAALGERAHLLAEARGRDRERVDGVGDPVVAEDAHARPGARAHPRPGDARALVGARGQVGGSQRRGALPEHLGVEPLDAVDHDLGRIAALHELAAPARAPRALGGIEQRLDDRGGERGRILGRDEPAGLARADDVGRATHGRGHDGAFERERLQRGQRESFAARGEHDEIRGGQIGSRVELAAREVHRVREAELGDAGDQRLGIRSAADQHEAGAGYGGEHLRKRLHQDVDALDREVARDAHDARPAVGKRRRGRFERGALELLDVDAGRHELDARRQAVTPHALGRGFRHGRDARAPARSSRAAARSSDSSMPWTVVSSGVRGSAIATISIDRTDCVCAMSGRNSLRSSAASGTSPGTAAGSGARSGDGERCPRRRRPRSARAARGRRAPRGRAPRGRARRRASVARCRPARGPG